MKSLGLQVSSFMAALRLMSLTASRTLDTIKSTSMTAGRNAIDRTMVSWFQVSVLLSVSGIRIELYFRQGQVQEWDEETDRRAARDGLVSPGLAVLETRVDSCFSSDAGIVSLLICRSCTPRHTNVSPQYSDSGWFTCAGYPGSFSYEERDAKSFQDWGFNYLK